MKRLTFLLLTLLLATSAFAQSRSGSTCPIVAQRAAANITLNGDNTVVASEASRRIFVWQWFLVNSHATQDESVTLKEGSTSTSGAYLLKAAGGSHTAPCTGTPWAIVPAGSSFIVNLSAAGSLQGTVYYTMEP